MTPSAPVPPFGSESPSPPPREHTWFGASAVAAGIWVIAGVAVLFFLREGRELLIPIVLAILISHALEPVVAWLRRHAVPRVVGAGVLLIALLAGGLWAASSLKDDAEQALDALPTIARRARELIADQGESGAGRRIREAAEQLEGTSTPAPAEGDPAAPGSGPAAPSGNGSILMQWVQAGVGSAMALAGHITVIFFLVFFLLIAGDHFRQRLTEIAGPAAAGRRTAAAIIDDINAQVQRFLLVQLVTASIVALATSAVLAWMGIGQAAIWGILAGVFNSIPYFGPVIVSGGLLLVGLAQSGDITRAVQVSAAALTITSLEGWLLVPPLMGRAQHMHAVVVFLGVLVWTWLWGAWGTVLAVPMLVVVKSVADHVESLRPLSRLMSP